MLLKQKKKGERLFLEYGKVSACLILLVGIVVMGARIYILVRAQTLTVSFLDVGQGDAILIQTPSGHTMLVDGGPSDRVLEKVSEKMSYFNHHIDAVVATHPDVDHITGLIPILQKYEVDHIITSPVGGHTGVFDTLQKSIEEEGDGVTSDHHAQVHVGQEGDEIQFGDGVVAYILYPSPTTHIRLKDTNDASVSIVVTYGQESVLLTGDLPSTHEGELISKGLPRNITIYKAGHHGSKYSSGDQLLSYVRPEYAVISAGKDNKYGHPNMETMERLKTYAKEVITTIERGTVSFELDGTSVTMKSDR